MGKSILLVDDVSDSGRTLSLVKQLLLAGGGEVRTVVLYRKPRIGAQPDVRVAKHRSLDHVPVELRGPGALLGSLMPEAAVGARRARLGRGARAGRTRTSRRWGSSCALRRRRDAATCLRATACCAPSRSRWPTCGCSSSGRTRTRRRGIPSDSRSRSSATCVRSRGACRTSTRSCDDDLGIPPAAHGDLTAWSQHGVMLLNRVLTVQAGASGSHRGKGWEARHRGGHPRARGPRRPARRDPVGAGCRRR